MADEIRTTRDCSMCRHADFDAGEPGLCWRLPQPVVMPEFRCEYYDMDECFKEIARG